MDLFDQWGVREAGLYTFAQSPKHVALYQKFGFWPRFLTAIMSKVPVPQESSGILFSSLKPEQKDEVLRACTVLTDSIHDGLDVTSEIRSVSDQSLGETVYPVVEWRLAGRLRRMPLRRRNRSWPRKLLHKIRSRRISGTVRRSPYSLRSASGRARITEAAGRRESRQERGLQANARSRIPYRRPGNRDASPGFPSLQSTRRFRAGRLALKPWHRPTPQTRLFALRVAHAFLRAVSRLISTPLPNR